MKIIHTLSVNTLLIYSTVAFCGSVQYPEEITDLEQATNTLLQYYAVNEAQEAAVATRILPLR